MATKTMNIGSGATTVDVNVNGNVVGNNIKSKGNSTTPVYFDANGVAQLVTNTVTSIKVNNVSYSPTDGVVDLGTIQSGTTVEAITNARIDEICNIRIYNEGGTSV